MMCRKEQAKAAGTPMHVLRNTTFHKSLFACSVEVAAFTLNKTSLLVRLRDGSSRVL